MYTDYLKPVSKELQDFAKSCNSFCIGPNVYFELNGLDEAISKSKDKIAIIGLQENRSNTKDVLEDLDFELLRTAFYSLKKGNWQIPIFDFGDLIPSSDKISFIEIATKTINSLLKDNYFVLILGGSPSLSYAQYRAYDDLVKNLHFVSVDEKIRLGNELQNVNDDNYLTKIITSEPLNLMEYSNIGYQTYFVAQEELDLSEHLNFDALRLGQLTSDIKEVEPLVRNANATVINLNAIEANYFSSTTQLTPNGLNSREICGVAKYLGTSYNMSSVYISNYVEKYKHLDHLLLSQIIWYIVDGRNIRPELKSFDDLQYFEKYYVPTDIEDFIFYRQISTNQWSIEVKSKDNENKIIIPCSKKDYDLALEGEIPSKWWKFFKKFY